MTYPSGLNRDEATAVAREFGVALHQVHRDHLISSILAALQAHTDDPIFFGGTALARTYLMQGRLSEDIDLIAVTDRRSVARAISRTTVRDSHRPWSAQDHMFTTAPTIRDWHEQLSGQTRLAVGPEEALNVVRAAWSAARS